MIYRSVSAALLLFTAQLYGSESDSCPSAIILEYLDFAPQSVACELIGNEWYQWDSHGSSDPGETYDVRVVIYKDVSLSQAESIHPVIKYRRDCRYVEYGEALEFIDEKICGWETELESEREESAVNLWHNLIRAYVRTREKITDEFCTE